MAKASTKKCTVCEVDKEISEFKGKFYKRYNATYISKTCISCAKEIRNLPENKERRGKYNKEYRKNNEERLKIYRQEYFKNNKKYILSRYKTYYKNNKEAIIKNVNEYSRKKRAINSKYRIRMNMSCIIWHGLRKNKFGKGWQTLVPYSIEQLMGHLESKFTKGMTWENYGKNGWEIDHVIPHSLFKYDSHDHPAFKACWSLENLQPLWATTKIAVSFGENKKYQGNLEKSNKIKLSKKQEKLLNLVNKPLENKNL